jgi:hypothetical protein
MRYIKSYKLFESLDYINSTIEDILRDLEDSDIQVEIYNWDGIEVFLTNRKEHTHTMLFGTFGRFTAPDSFPYETIKPNIEHLVSFLKENGWIIDSIYNVVDLKPSNIEYKDLNGKEIGRLELRFVKV